MDILNPIYIFNGGKHMNYRVQLNTDSQLFTVVDKNNSKVFSNGRTIEEAVKKFKSL